MGWGLQKSTGEADLLCNAELRFDPVESGELQDFGGGPPIFLGRREAESFVIPTADLSGHKTPDCGELAADSGDVRREVARQLSHLARMFEEVMRLQVAEDEDTLDAHEPFLVAKPVWMLREDDPPEQLLAVVSVSELAHRDCCDFRFHLSPLFGLGKRTNC